MTVFILDTDTKSLRAKLTAPQSTAAVHLTAHWADSTSDGTKVAESSYLRYSSGTASIEMVAAPAGSPLPKRDIINLSAVNRDSVPQTVVFYIDDGGIENDIFTVPLVTGQSWNSSAGVATSAGVGLSDAPSDGSLYGRQNAAWAAVTGTGGGPETDPLSLHLNQATPQTLVSGTPFFAGGLRSTYIDKLALGTAPSTPAANTLRLYVETEPNSLFEVYKYKDDVGMVRELVRDSVFIVEAGEDNIPIMAAVYALGSDNEMPLVGYAMANSGATMPCIGLMVASMTSTGDFGRVMMVGLLEGVDTSTFVEGDVLYVSSTVPGGLTVTPPTPPDLTQEIGTVLVSSPTAGKIQVISRSVNATEYDPLSLHLNQAAPQTFTNFASGTGLMKVTSGLLGLDTNQYITGGSLSGAMYQSVYDPNSDGIIDIAQGGTNATGTVAARANLGLAIGSDIEAFDPTLLSIAMLGTVADRTIFTSGTDSWMETPLTAAGRALIDDVDAAAQRVTLGAAITGAYVPIAQVTGGGVIATGGFTGTFPATGIVAMLDRANTFTAIQTTNAPAVFQYSADAYCPQYVLRSFADMNAGPYYNFDKARGSIAAPTIVNAWDYIGSFFFRGYDGVGWRAAAGMVCNVDGTPGSGSMPGSLTFSTTPAGSVVLVEFMHATSTQMVIFAKGIYVGNAVGTATDDDIICDGTIKTAAGKEYDLGGYTTGTVAATGYLTMIVDGITYQVPAKKI